VPEERKTPMSAYLVFIREQTLDAGELEIYWSKIRATFAGHEVKVLASYGRHEDLEGSPTEGTVIAEFPLLNFPVWKQPKPGTKALLIVRSASTDLGEQFTEGCWSQASKPGMGWCAKYVDALLLYA
jgi:uncharacterized protein (DUF1330 family)